MGERQRMQRLHCEAAISERTAIEATEAQVHYLRNVLRLRDGDRILLFNGVDGEWLAELASEGRRRIRLVPVEQTRPQPPRSDLLFCFAPIRAGRLEYLVQKATEMGAGAIQPVMTQYTQPARIGTARLQANIIEAAEQCGILSVPELLPLQPLAELLDGWQQGRALIFCDEAADAASPLATLAGLRGRPLGVLIGPEGGFSPAERERLLKLDFVTPVSLGPRILRADTAAVAALAIVQAAAGDWSAGDFA